jgi:hypothetical protein
MKQFVAEPALRAGSTCAERRFHPPGIRSRLKLTPVKARTATVE